MATKTKTKRATNGTTTSPTSQKARDEVIISAPTTPITAASSKPTDVDTPPPMATDGKEIPTPAAAPKVDIFSKEFCGELWGAVVFDRLAATRGEHWKLSPAEKATIGETSAAVLNRYVGEYLGEFPELAAFLISAVVIAAPRLMKDGKIKREARELVKGASVKVQSGQEPVLPDSVTGDKQPGSSSGK